MAEVLNDGCLLTGGFIQSSTTGTRSPAMCVSATEAARRPASDTCCAMSFLYVRGVGHQVVDDSWFPLAPHILLRSSSKETRESSVNRRIC